MTDKLEIRKQLDSAEETFSSISHNRSEFYAMLSMYRETSQIFVFDCSDKTFFDFCKERYRTRNRNKQSKEFFDISNITSKDLFDGTKLTLLGCKLVSFLEDMKLAYIKVGYFKSMDK